MHYFDLSHFSLLKISGKDACEFLHAQVTCDLSQLDTYGWLPGAWCMPNGRVIATFFTYRNENNFYLITPGMLREKIIKRMGMFILRSDVTISDETDNMTLMGLYGDECVSLIKRFTGNSPDRDSLLIEKDSIVFLKMPDPEPRYMISCAMDGLTTVMNLLPADAIEGNREMWSLLDINAGIPWIINSTTEQFLPQMLNLDESGGLSFSKGCYPGQEIIARVRYRGHLKKKMYLGKGKPCTLPGPGDRLFSGTGDSPVGEIIDAEFNAEREVRFLAVVDIAHSQDPHLFIMDEQKTEITLGAFTCTR